MRIHKKVWLWWGDHWAIQLYWAKCISFGIHIDFEQPYIDIHFLWGTFSFGNNPIITNERDRYRGSCRGFLFRDSALL